MVIKPCDVHEDFGAAKIGVVLTAQALGVEVDVRLQSMWLVKMDERDRKAFLEIAQEVAEESIYQR
jgi:hypothetical protein